MSTKVFRIADALIQVKRYGPDTGKFPGTELVRAREILQEMPPAQWPHYADVFPKNDAPWSRIHFLLGVEAGDEVE